MKPRMAFPGFVNATLFHIRKYSGKRRVGVKNIYLFLQPCLIEPFIVAGAVPHIIAPGSLQSIEIIAHESAVGHHRHHPDYIRIFPCVTLGHRTRTIGGIIVSHKYLIWMTAFLPQYALYSPSYFFPLVVGQDDYACL